MKREKNRGKERRESVSRVVWAARPIVDARTTKLKGARSRGKGWKSVAVFSSRRREIKTKRDASMLNSLEDRSVSSRNRGSMYAPGRVTLFSFLLSRLHASPTRRDYEFVSLLQVWRCSFNALSLSLFFMTQKNVGSLNQMDLNRIRETWLRVMYTSLWFLLILVQNRAWESWMFGANGR